MSEYTLHARLRQDALGEYGEETVLARRDFPDTSTAVLYFTSAEIGNVLLGDYNTELGVFSGVFGVRYQVVLDGKVVHSGEDNQFSFGRDFPDT